jgi:hypothetical protein
MRHRFIQDLYGRSFDSPLLSGCTSTLVHDDVKRTAGRTVTVSEESERRFLLAKETVSDVLVGATCHRAGHCVVASVLCLRDIASRRGLV